MKTHYADMLNTDACKTNISEDLIACKNEI